MTALLRSIESLRDRLLFAWYGRDKGHAVFFAALPLPFVVLGSLVHLANTDRERLQAERHRRAELFCLAENVYFEARGEPEAGQFAVAEVTMNRVRSPRFPATVCDVVHEKRWDAIRKRYVGAFSWTELPPRRKPEAAAWERAFTIAETVYDGQHAPAMNGALFYHATSIEPSWARTMRPVATVGRHAFYR